MSTADTNGPGANIWPQATDPTSSISNPDMVNLTAVAEQGLNAQVVCFLNAGEPEFNGSVGVHISAIFVVLVVSTAVTFFPVMATRMKSLKIPLYPYLFARYFGAGVIIATAFIHLLDPAYDEIGPASCVGMTGGWAQYSWVPAIAMTSGLVVFLMDFAAERYVEKKYGLAHAGAAQGGAEGDPRVRAARAESVDYAMMHYELDNRRKPSHQALHSADQDAHLRQDLQQGVGNTNNESKTMEDGYSSGDSLSEKELEELNTKAFQQQIAAFLILEFGVIFHSVIIGLTLGTAGDEFSTLYVVVVFHQSFEGLGIGARLSSIPFPKKLKWMPWFLCLAYGLTTPIAIAIGLGVRTTYNGSSNTANIVSGILDATSAGILLFTGFVELLARDFLFNPERTNNDRQLGFMVFCVLLGAALMALLGKWA